jgi:hypothetical protein
MAWQSTAEVISGPGYRAVLEVEANGGTVTLQFQDDAGNWIAIDDGVFSADTRKIVEFGNGTDIRVLPAGGAKFRWDWIT